MELGYKLCAEEQDPQQLVRCAQRAEEAGFTFACISDHFHPWVDKQGESVFVWGAIGAIGQATENLRIGTAVTCPTIRIHPAIIAQAAATAASLLPGRFFLGVGSGENLNEHILGDHWPPAATRRDMLEEAVEIIRLLWAGETESYTGAFYVVENARIYTMPKKPPPIYLAASGEKSAELAGRIADGLIGTSPDKQVLSTFDKAGGSGKPRYGEVTVCWAKSEKEARKTAFERWPNAGIAGELSAELATPAHFEQAVKMLNEDAVAEQVVCGPDPKPHLDLIKKYADAGYEYVYVHQVGPDQEGFFEFYEREIMPALNHVPKSMRKASR